MDDKDPVKEGGELQADGRKANAAQPLSAARDNEGAARYPDAEGDQANGEPRSFEPKVRNETAPPGRTDEKRPVSAKEGRLGPGGDPVEGKP